MKLKRFITFSIALIFANTSLLCNQVYAKEEDQEEVEKAITEEASEEVAEDTVEEPTEVAAEEAGEEVTVEVTEAVEITTEKAAKENTVESVEENEEETAEEVTVEIQEKEQTKEVTPKSLQITFNTYSLVTHFNSNHESVSEYLETGESILECTNEFNLAEISQKYLSENTNCDDNIYLKEMGYLSTIETQSDLQSIEISFYLNSPQDDFEKVVVEQITYYECEEDEADIEITEKAQADEALEEAKNTDDNEITKDNKETPDDEQIQDTKEPDDSKESDEPEKLESTENNENTKITKDNKATPETKAPEDNTVSTESEPANDISLDIKEEASTDLEDVINE